MDRDALWTHKITHTKMNSWWLTDVRGIEVSRVCEICEEAIKDQYDPAIFGEGPNHYDDIVEEQIEPDE